MNTIHVPFIKVWYRGVDYPLDTISEAVLGKCEVLSYRSNCEGKVHFFGGFYLPPFQRGDVWNTKRKIRLIESLFCEINIGPMMFVSNIDVPEIDGWLLDGKQRLTAIKDFVEGKFAVFNDRLSYKDLHNVQLKFDGNGPAAAPNEAWKIWRRVCLHFVRVEDVTDVALLRDLYNRLNFGGVAHKKSERA